MGCDDNAGSASSWTRRKMQMLMLICVLRFVTLTSGAGEANIPPYRREYCSIKANQQPQMSDIYSLLQWKLVYKLYKR